MTKVISLSDDAYHALKKMKAEKSFSQIILELAREKNNEDIMLFAGTLTEKEGKDMKKQVYKERQHQSRRFT